MPRVTHTATIRFKWSNEYTFNDGILDDLQPDDDPKNVILTAIDAYLEPNEQDEFSVVSYDIDTSEVNDEEQEKFLRNWLLGED